MPVLASITDPLVNFAVDVVDALGLPGIFVLMVLESACIPIPSEATMLFAGFNVALGEYSLFAVVATATVANVVGSWIAYAIGYYGRVDVLEKHGRKLHIKQSHLRTADQWFERYGSATFFLTRTSRGPTAGSSATATRQCSSRACCRSSARSSRCRPAWRGCRSGASRC